MSLLPSAVDGGDRRPERLRFDEDDAAAPPQSHPSPSHGHHEPAPVKSYHEQASQLPTAKLIHRTLRQMLKCASYAFVARIALGVLKTLARRGISRKAVTGVLEEALSANPWKWAVLVGSLASYRGVRVLLERCALLPPVAASLVAGSIASLGTFTMNIATRTELSLYLFVRALHGLIHTFGFPNAPWCVQNFQYWDVVMTGVTATQILYGLFQHPNSHSSSYHKFLLRAGMIDDRVVKAIGGLQRSQIDPKCIDLCMERRIPFPNGPTDVPFACTLKHPGVSCNVHSLQSIGKHLLRISLPLYVPLKVTTTLLFSWKKLLKHPLEEVKKIVVQSVSSSLFLTMYVIAPFRVLCLSNSNGLRAPNVNRWVVSMAIGAASAPSILLEQKQRRTDILLFSSMHALRCTYLMCYDLGWVPRPNRQYLTGMMTAALAVLFFQTDFYPELAHRNIRSSISWLLSEPHVVHHEHLVAKAPRAVVESPSKQLLSGYSSVLVTSL